MTAGSPGNSGQEGSSNGAPKQRVPKPKWLRVKLPTGEAYREVRNIVSEHKLHTICESGHCPNMGECWGEGTATFMISGQHLHPQLRFLQCGHRQAGGGRRF